MDFSNINIKVKNFPIFTNGGENLGHWEQAIVFKQFEPISWVHTFKNGVIVTLVDLNKLPNGYNVDNIFYEVDEDCQLIGQHYMQDSNNNILAFAVWRD